MEEDEETKTETQQQIKLKKGKKRKTEQDCSHDNTKDETLMEAENEDDQKIKTETQHKIKQKKGKKRKTEQDYSHDDTKDETLMEAENEEPASKKNKFDWDDIIIQVLTKVNTPLQFFNHSKWSKSFFFSFDFMIWSRCRPKIFFFNSLPHPQEGEIFPNNKFLRVAYGPRSVCTEFQLCKTILGRF